MRGWLAGLLGCGLAMSGAGPALAQGLGQPPVAAAAPGLSPSTGSSAQSAGPASPGAMPAGAVPLTLAEAVFIGLRENRAIRSEYLQRIADRFALRVAERVFVPRLDVQASTARTRTGNSTGSQFNVGPVVSWDTPTGARFQFAFLGSQDLPRGQQRAANSQLSFTVIQPLLAGGGVDFAMAPLRIARIGERNAQLRIKGAVIDQISAIIGAYRTLVQAQEQLRIATDSLRRARDLAEVNRALIAAGRLAQIEQIQSDTQLAQQELSLIGARNAQESARLSLLTLMALDQSSRVWAADRPAADQVRVDVVRATQVALATQPAFLQALLGIEIGRINLDVARNQRLWDVSLVAGAGPQVSRPDLANTIGALGAVRSDFNVGLRLNIPIGQLGREQGEVNATIQLRQLELGAEQARDRVRQQVDDAVRNVEVQRRQAELAKRARELTALQLQAELARLQAGRSSNFQVVSFQAALQSAESAELQAVIAYLNALTTLDQVLGTTLDTWRIALNQD